jgi:MYXO-CTERM domain-containing protein
MFSLATLYRFGVIVALVPGLFAAHALRADAVSGLLTTTTVTHQYISALSYLGDSFTGLSGDAVTVDSTTNELIFSIAPDGGGQFTIKDLDATTQSLQIQLSYGDTQGYELSRLNSISPLVSFVGASGTVPTLESTYVRYCTNASHALVAFQVTLNYAITGDYAFSSAGISVSGLLGQMGVTQSASLPAEYSRCWVGVVAMGVADQSGVLSITPVPEPTDFAAALGIGALGLIGLLRRRRAPTQG